MKKLYLIQLSLTSRSFLIFLALFLNLIISVSAQESQRRLIEGILRDDSGEALPLPGVNVVIKGTTIGTVTDIDGFYSIEASVGDILVYSSVGFVTYEVEVGENNSAPKERPKKELNKEDFTAYKKRTFTQNDSKRNTAYLDTDGQFFRFNYKNTSRWSLYGTPITPGKKYNFLPQSIKQIRYVSPQKLYRKYGVQAAAGIYEVSERRTGPYYKNIGLIFNTSFSSSSPYRLPALQNQYVQGRPQNGTAVWQGPETGEIFSWGPEISSLEFDGQVYPWDQNGRLVLSGTGNGMAAKVYDPYNFFYRNGQTIHNYLKLHLPIVEDLTSEVDIEYGAGSSYVPGSESDKIRGGLKFKYNGNYIDVSGNLSYGEANQTLPTSGANYASIFSSIMRSPISFDNTNGLGAEKAFNNPGSYLLENGTQRSQALNRSDNPYWLLNTFPDKGRQSHFVAGIKIDQGFWNWYCPIQLSLTASYSAEQLYRQFGYAPNSSAFPNGRLTSRDQSKSLFSSLLEANIRKNWSGFQLDAGAQNIITGDFKALDRIDELNLNHPGSLVLERQFRGERWSYEPGLLAKMQFGPGYYSSAFKINLYLNSYLTNTLKEQFFILPAVGASVDIDEMADLGDAISGVKIRGQFANSVKEAPLLYPSLSFNTLNFRSDEYVTYFENEELILSDPGVVLPETHSKFETGIDLNFFYHVLNFEYNFYINNVDDLIYPMLENDGYELQNIASATTVGHEIEIELHKPTHNDFDLSARLAFHSFDQTVKKLNSQLEYLRISGFSDVYGVAMTGEPLGMLYGSKYLRNDQGQVIIGADGYPLVDGKPGPLASPVPDWTGGFETSFYYKWFTLSVLIETSQGGKIWNGTNNILNYLGRSTESAELRNTTNYVFDGVNEVGSPNTIPVDFADPALPLSENRWVRFGFSGVAEEAIEDASWTRLSEIKLSYDFSDALNRLFNRRFDGTISVFAKDLFINTGYSGSNPAGTLFSYPALSGFELFNAPITRTFGLSLTFKNF